MFCHTFGSAGDTLDSFPNMFAACAKATENPEPLLYAHNIADSAQRGTLAQRVFVPHRRSTASIVLQLDHQEQNKWEPNIIGDFFSPADVVSPETAMLIPAWRVAVHANQICPQWESRPLEFCLRERLVIEPGKLMLVTIALN